MLGHQPPGIPHLTDSSLETPSVSGPARLSKEGMSRGGITSPIAQGLGNVPLSKFSCSLRWRLTGSPCWMVPKRSCDATSLFPGQGSRGWDG